MSDFKSSVAEFWERVPCGTRGVAPAEGSREFFASIERDRDAKEPFIARFADFAAWRGKKVLEVGVGAATDFVKFARHGARLYGVDLTPHAWTWLAGACPWKA